VIGQTLTKILFVKYHKREYYIIHVRDNIKYLVLYGFVKLIE